MSPVTVKCSAIAVKRCGTSAARWPANRPSALSDRRPLRRMWIRSIAMQPVTAKPSACIGDGPATPALSSGQATFPDRPPKTRSCSQISSTMVGGLPEESAIRGFYARCEGIAEAKAPDGGALTPSSGEAGRSQAACDRCGAEPPRWKRLDTASQTAAAAPAGRSGTGRRRRRGRRARSRRASGWLFGKMLASVSSWNP